MINLDEMRNLIEKLNYYTKLYDEGHPEITDKQWDDMYFQLQKMEEESGITLSNSPTMHIDYVIKNQLNKVKHNHPMLSLAKTKSEKDVVNFLQEHDAIAMAKMDGLTCSLRYLNGTLVSAETRGNGEVGEDITHNIVFVKGVPLEIPIKEEVIVDGEVICTYEDFKEFSNQYANPRNFAAGSIRLLDAGECAKRHLTFVAWDCIKGLEQEPHKKYEGPFANEKAKEIADKINNKFEILDKITNTLTHKLYVLNDLGFIVVPYIHYLEDIERTSDKVKHINILIKENAKELDYPIDGVVYKYNDCRFYESLGQTSHHARGGLAFKFYDEEYESELLDIEYTMGKTGVLTPVAIFSSVDDGESIVTRASLHNLNIMGQMLGHAPYYGEKIKVAKMNMIIPQITWAEKRMEFEDKHFEIPKNCPICGKSTIQKDDFLYCSNPNCEGKFINRLDHFCGKKGLDIKGLSKATLQKLINWDWVESISDLYKLKEHRDEWIQKEGFGSKSVDNILTIIKERSINCELSSFICALSIPLIGSSYAKEIAKQCKDWIYFMECVDNHMGQIYDFTQWDGFGFEIDKALHNFDYTEANYLIDNGYIILKNSLYKTSENINSNTEITGKIFCVTGKLNIFNNRDELIKAVETAGGKVASSISKKTNYLVTNDTESGSSKNIKARQLNIPIINEKSLIDMLQLTF